jgi:hypothetical protein
MNRLAPCKRRDFIKKLRALGFDGPYSGTRHEFMLYQSYRLAIPSNDEYSVPQLKMMFAEIEGIIEKELGADVWNAL